jgi:catechol 2,3-dioxygenase-like lactoylglutathione lyase family enzyme
MALKHLNIAVPDVAQTKAFFETYFGFTCQEVKGDNIIAILEDKDGFILSVSNFKKDEIPQYPPDFHIGFMQDTPDQVMDVYQTLKAGGVTVGPEPKRYGGRGTMSFYVTAPGNVLVEVLCEI